MGKRKPDSSDDRRTERVAFARTKYGPELLVDVAWVHEMPKFMREGPHRLDFHDILLVTQGEGVYSLDGHAHAVKAGTVLFTAPQQVRRWAARDVDGLCLVFLPNFVTEFFSDADFVERLPYFNCRAEAASLRLRADTARHVKRRLLDMRREFSDLKSDSTHILRAGLYEVLITLGRAFHEAHPQSSPRPLNPITTAFRALVAQRVRRDHGVAAYAARLNVGANHLNALCKRHLGTNAKAVISHALAVEARRALSFSDRTTEAIAEALGFVDASYFTRFFKRVTGMTPSGFREKQRQASGLPRRRAGAQH